MAIYLRTARSLDALVASIVNSNNLQFSLDWNRNDDDDSTAGNKHRVRKIKLDVSNLQRQVLIHDLLDGQQNAVCSIESTTKFHIQMKTVWICGQHVSELMFIHTEIGEKTCNILVFRSLAVHSKWFLLKSCTLLARGSFISTGAAAPTNPLEICDLNLVGVSKMGAYRRRTGRCAYSILVVLHCTYTCDAQ